MRNQPIDVAGSLARLGQRGTRRLFEHTDRQLEDRLPLHLQQRIAQDLTASDMPRHAQNADMASIGMQVAGQDAWLGARLQHQCARAVAKQHTGGSVCEVKNTRKNFGTDDQGLARGPSFEHGIGHGKGIDKAAANRLHIKRRAAIGAELVLKNTGRGREDHVRRGRGDNDQIDVTCLQTSGLQRSLAGH